MSSLIIWTLAISGWGVIAPLVAFKMGEESGAQRFRRAYFRHPSVRALDEVPATNRSTP